MQEIEQLRTQRGFRRSYLLTKGVGTSL